MIGVASSKCDFNCTEDTPGAELESNDTYKCNGALSTHSESQSPISPMSLKIADCEHANLSYHFIYAFLVLRCAVHAIEAPSAVAILLCAGPSMPP